MPPKKRFTDDSFRREPWFKALCQAFLTCRSEEDAANLFRDIGTLSELQAWSERLEVAKNLVRGLSYRQVAAVTGASTTTVTRVARFIENGTGGYRKVLHAHRHHRLVNEQSNNQVPSTNDPNEKRIDEQTRNVPSGSPQSTPASKGARPHPVSVLQKYLDRK
ncbi:MAG: YerC/YecD family TrpR-related protein [Candidatus Peribacteraceae bacterium]|jgi:TrpR-related protein YerC/YecD